MSLFRKAVFHTTVANLHDLPGDALCEVAFAGRSNAGKSSAINTLANHTRLAYVSKTPGRTQHLNYFRLEEGKYFVDLPGYGYAKAPEEIRSQWEGLLAPYLRYRQPLAGLVLIMDSRHPLTDLDIQMLTWFAQTGKPVHVLLSKADKLSRQEQAAALQTVKAALTQSVGTFSLQLFSSLKQTGIAEAEAVLGAWLGMASSTDTPTPPGAPVKRLRSRTAKPSAGALAVPPNRQAAIKSPRHQPGAKVPDCQAPAWEETGDDVAVALFHQSRHHHE